MQAQVIRGHGQIDDIVFETHWPQPIARSGEVVLKVKACSLNYHDLFTLRGMPGIKLQMPLIMGTIISDFVTTRAVRFSNAKHTRVLQEILI